MSDFDFTSALKKLGRQTVTDQIAAEEEQVPAPRRALRFDKGIPIEGARTPSQEATTFDKRALATGTNAVQVGADATVGLTEGVMSRLDPNRKIGLNEQFEIDQQTMPPGEFAIKYGREAEIARYFGAQDVNPSASRQVANREDNRTTGQKYIDRSLAAGGAAVSMTADTAGAIIRTGGALPGADALRMVPGADKIFNQSANAISDGGTAVSGFLNSGKSQTVKDAPALTAQTSAARMADSALELEQSDGGIKEQFRRIGREAVISASAYNDNRVAVDDTVSAAVGSMLPSLMAAGGVRSLTTGLLNKLGVTGIPKAAVETLATAATVGAMEGAGAYSQTRNEILDMSPQELMEESKLYKELTDSGLSHEQAVTEVAEQAAMSAQIMTTMVASGISIPFAGFEGGFFTRSGRKFLLELGGEELASASKEVIAETLKNAPKTAIAGARNRAGTTLFEAGQDIAGQTVEESAQNAAATFAGNVAIQQYADQSRQVSEEVGQAITEGAIGGIGATAIMQSKDAPALLKDYTKQLTGVVTAIGKEIGKPLAKAQAAKKGEKEIQKTAAIIEARFNQASEIVSAIERMDAGEEVTPEARAALEKARVELAPHIKAFQDTDSPEYLQRTGTFKNDVVPGSKLKTLLNVSRRLALNDGKQYKEGSKQEADASDFLLDELGRINTIIEELQVNAQKTELAEGTQRTEEEESQAIAQAKARAAEFTENMAETPVFAEALTKASQILNEESAKAVEAGGSVIPVKSLTELIRNPVGIDANRITPEVDAAMSPEGKKVAAVVRAIQSPEHAERKDPLKGNRTNTREGTRNEVFFQSKGLKFGEVASFNDMMSQLLLGAVRQARNTDGSVVTVSNTQGVQVSPIDVFDDLKAMVKHQANKYAAATESYNYSLANPDAKDTTRKFESLSQKSNKFKKDGGSIYVNAAKPNSLRTYRSIAEEFNTGVRAVNALIEQFPDLYKGEKLQEVPLPVVPETIEGTTNAAAPQKSETTQNQQTQPTQVVADTNVGDNPDSVSDAVLSNKMSFKDLFNGGSETTFADSIQYLLGLDSLDALQQQVLNMVTASGFARANPNTIVRKATAEENKKTKSKHGWWDPQANEIVLFVEDASNLLHEMVHAVTLEALFQNLAQAHIKKKAGKELSQIEQAAYNLNMAALEFMEEKPLNAEVAAVQGLMRALVDPTKPIAQQDRGMARAISEYMAYGLTNNQVKKQLVAKKTGKTETNKEADLVDAIAKVARVFLKELGKFVGNKTKRVDETNLRDALDDLYFNTKALALDSQTTVLKAREVQRVEARDVKNNAQKETGPGTTERKTPGEKKAAEPTETEPAAVREPVAEPAQAEVSSAQAEETDTTLPADDGPEQNAPAQEADDLTNQIAQGLLKIIQAAADKAVPPPAAAPAVSATSKTPEASTADAVAPTDVVSAPATPAATQVAGRQTQKLEAKYKELVKKVDNLTKTEAARTQAGEPAADLEKLRANLEKATKERDDLATQLNKTTADAPVEVAPKPTIEEVVQKAVEPAKTYVPSTEEINSMLSNLKSEMDGFETSLKALNDDLESIYNNQFKKSALYKEIPLTLPQFKAIAKGDTKSAPYKAGMAKMEAYNNLQRAARNALENSAKALDTTRQKAQKAGDTVAAKALSEQIAETEVKLKAFDEADLGQKLDDVIGQAVDVANEMPGVITAFETARKAYEYELKAAGRKAETISSPVVEEAATEDTKPEPVVVPPNAVFVPAPVEQVLGESIPDPVETPPVIDVVRAPDVGAALPEGWKPDYELGTTLFGSKGQAFINRIVKSLKPILQPGDKFNDLLNRVAPSLPYNITQETRTQLNQVLKDTESVVNGMQERLQKQMSTVKGWKGKSLLQEVAGSITEADNSTGNEPGFVYNRGARFRILTWLENESVKSGKPQFDKHLLRLAVLAVADYVMQNQNPRGVYKPEDIMKHLGLSKRSAVTKEMEKLINLGLPGTLVKDDLAKHIREFMGAEVNEEISQSETDGIFEALAHEILDYLGSQPKDAKSFNYWISEIQIPVYKRTVTVFKFGKPEGWPDKQGKNILKDVLTSRSSDVHQYSVGEKWSSDDVAKRLKKDKSIKTSAAQREAAQAEQDVPFFWSKDMWELYTALLDPKGEAKTIASLLGHKTISNTTFFNESNENSVAGKNASVSYGINEAMHQIEMIRAYVEKYNSDPNNTKIEPWDVPVYYRISFGKNTRSNFEGFNPKSNKFAREMFTPTRHTIDLTNPEQVDGIYIAIAQSLGEKVENLGPDGSVEAAKKKLVGDYAVVMEILNSGNLSEAKAQLALIAEVENLGGLAEDAFTLKGLWTAKKLAEAIARGDTEFETDMYQELDGKTNGPIAVAIQYFTGRYTPEIIANWRRGGYFLNNALNQNDSVSYHQWRNGVEQGRDPKKRPTTPLPLESNADFYGRIAELTSSGILWVKRAISIPGQLFEKELDAVEQKKANKALALTMGVLNFDQNFEVKRGPDGEMVIAIKRGFTKQPITANIYGSGVRSISETITGDLFNQIYEDLTKVGRGDKQALENLRKVATHLEDLFWYEIVFDEFYTKPQNIKTDNKAAGPSLKALLQNDNPSKEFLRSFRFSEEQAEYLATNIQTFFGTAFQQSVDTAVDSSVRELSKNLVKGSQTHGKLYKRIVDNALKQKHAELVEAGVILKTEELPMAVRRQVLDFYKDFAPVIDNGSAAFKTGGQERETSTQVSNRIFGQKERNKEAVKNGKPLEEVEPEFYPRNRTLSGKEIDSRRATVGLPKTEVLALMAQVNSDALMQIKIWLNKKYPRRALAVYDGNNHATTDVKAASYVMNEAMASVWQTNTLRPVQESYEKTMAAFDRILNDPKTPDSVKKVLKDSSGLRNKLESHRDELTHYVLKRDARIAAETQLYTSFQGVPGGDVPFVTDGLRFNTDQEMIDFLNTETDRIYNALLNSTPPTTIMKSVRSQDPLSGNDPVANEDFKKALNGKTRFKGKEVLQFLETANQFAESADQYSVMSEVINSVALNTAIEAGLEIVIHSDLKETEQADAWGFYNSYTNQLVLDANDLSSETTLHEIIHAATINAIYKIMLDPEFAKANPELKKEVDAIDKMMNSFLAPTKTNPDGTWSFIEYPKGSSEESIQQILTTYLDEDFDLFSKEKSRMRAISEFVAYALSRNKTLEGSRAAPINLKTETITKQEKVLGESKYSENFVIRIAQLVSRSVMRLFRPKYKMEYYNRSYNETVKVPSTTLDSWGRKLMISTRNLMNMPYDGFIRNLADSMIEQAKANPDLVDPAALQEITNSEKFKFYSKASTISPDSDISRKLDLQNKVATQVSEFLKARRRGDSEAVTRARRAGNQAAYTKAKNDATEALNTMAAAGFTVKGPQDILLFQTIHAVVAADMKMDKVALQELQLIYNAVIEKLGTDSFEKFGPAGVSGQLQSTRMYAAVLGQSFFDVTGAREFLPPRGPAGVERLASFIALAQTSPEMRQILSEIDLSSLNLNTSIDTKSGLDGLLGSFGENMMNRMTGRILEATGSQSSPVNETLDVLTDMLLDYDTQAATSFETDVSTSLMGINAALKQGISSAAVSISDSLQRSASNAESEISETVQNLAAAFVDILDENRASVRAEMTTKLLNKDNVWEPIRNLFAEMRAMSEDTAGVLRLVKKAKNMIARVRSEYIENVPKIIRESFGSDFAALRSDEKQQIMQTLFVGLGKTDFAAVSKIIGSRSALKFFGTDKAAKDALQSEIRQLKKSLGSRVEALGLPKAVEMAYAKKAEQLADYMINKKLGPNTLTSAVSILNLHNEDGHSITEAEYKELQTVLKARKNERSQYTDKTRQLIDTIDALVSMEAIARLDDSVHNNMAKFIGSNQKAVLAAIDYQIELHRQESEKVDLNSAAALNGIKGAFLTNSQHKHSVIVADIASEKTLRERGYTRVRDFNGPAEKFDPSRGKKAYYFSAHNSLATYNQGVIQTVQDTYFGVDPRTGLMIGAETTGNRITGKEMSLLNRRLKAYKGQQFEDGIIPRFDAAGGLVAFQEAVSSDVFTLLNQTNDYADSLGRWAGRIQEEKASHGLNAELIDAAKAMYDRDVAAGRGNEYAAFGREPKEGGNRDLKNNNSWDLNLKEGDDWDSENGTVWDFTDDLLNDSVWLESYLLMPRDAREYAEEVFGGPMMVRRDMINNTFGFRSASIGDIFTGKSRMSPEMAEALKNVFMATPFLGKDAYKWLTMTEEALQGLVSGVKHIIVVKSGVVMIANTMANVFQLATREVPLSYITQRTRSKWAELEQYKKNEDLKIKLRFDYLSSKSNSERANIQARLDSINEVNEKMTIWPLIQANQFTTISEGLTDADTAIFNKGFGDWIERKAGELPGPLSTVARYALISKDTALYQGLAKGVQYGDFIAKAIYYDFLTEERGVDTEAAMLKIDQEFINYDLNDSRLRSYLESVGITWFMNFKIRSLKIAIDMIRNNPATALLMLGTGGLFGIGSPIVDNIVSVTADGRLGYSIGPGMFDAAWNLNFWNQISGNG